MIALFSEDGKNLIHAVWINDPFTGFYSFNGIANELMLVEILSKVYKENHIDVDTIKTIHKFYRNIFAFETEVGNQIT